ncbi:MAG: NADH-quinone oxidoreductase subunit L [SAR202 cluster bacterium]|nr:NADH-quinone oxidoreductase subunit L [SAR202 cluster bacterium]
MTTTASPIKFLSQIAAEAAARRKELLGGKTRHIVQVAHCSLAVGADKVVAAVRQAVGENEVIIVAGCDGTCFQAPKTVTIAPDGRREVKGHGVESDFFALQKRIAMDGCGEIDATDVDDYLAHGGYAGLAKALSMSPEAVIEEVKASGLRGRGGAYFPAAMKWEGARKVRNSPKYLVVNAEEGEPGIFKDRHLMEGVPHRIIEGMAIAAYATGINEAYVYINAEANLSAHRMEKAIARAKAAGLLCEKILGSDFTLNVTIMRGAGGYVCGEETTLLNTMEGYRREPRLRPPFPTTAGLWAKPTVINNCETLANVPFIMAKGAKAYAAIGAWPSDSKTPPNQRASGTKIVSLSGSVHRPGVVELPMGTTLRQIIEAVGNGPMAGHALTGVAVGGPSSGVFPTSMLDTQIAPGLLHESGVMLGAGGVIALDERTPALDVVRRLAAYNAAESCGKCTPCREGTPRMVDALDRILSGKGAQSDIEELRYLADVVGAASLCGLGQAAGSPITSALRFFGDEIAMRVASGAR